VTSADIASLRLENLFGYLDHEVTFRPGIATILTGPNGSGKTHVLSILRALVALDFYALSDEPFGSATLVYRSNETLSARRVDDGAAHLIEVSGTDRHGELIGEFQVDPRERSDQAPVHIPPWIRHLGPDEFYDTEAGEYLTSEDMRIAYGSPEEETGTLVDVHDWLRPFVPPAQPTFIQTGRLDIAVSPPLTQRPLRTRRRPAPRSAIERYVAEIKNQITEARRASLSVSQRADRQFAARALNKARASLREPDLRQRYEAIAALHHELHANALTEETIAVAFPSERTTPTERRILNVFLEDWEEKLVPLQPVHQKLQTLRGIVENKLRDKEMRVSPRGDVSFVSPTGEDLTVDLLSSGEQHMLALFTMLLFTAAPGSLVLIDEPEISLHAAWKHAFLDDLKRISELMPVKVILATHSTALINSQWDLVEELVLTR
jgi:energy-coupling factor transporter ATP-binding protein EcfA2